MHDTLAYFQHDPIYRRYHHHELTFSLVYAFTENFILPLSHDEVVHGKGSLLSKMPGDRWQKLANLRSLYAYMWAHPGKKLLFMGQEFAQEAEWSENRSLDWHLLENPEHAGIQSLVRDLNTRLQGRAGAVGDGLRRPRLLVDRGQRGRRQRDRVRAPHEGLRARGAVRRQLLARGAHQLPDRAAARRPLARGGQHRRGRTTAARASGTWAASTPRRSAGTASRSRPRSRCRRSARSGWCPSERRCRDRDGGGSTTSRAP